jgi:hypothetical protein
MFLICEFFSLSPDVLRVYLLLGSLLLDHKDVCKRIRFLPILLLFLVLTTLMSPFMNDLWIRLGTGNANFLFFQGLVMWTILALFICEYTIAYGKLNNLEKAKNEELHHLNKIFKDAVSFNQVS